MRINDDLTKPALINGAKLDWVPSPAAGVDRRMLFRIGGEVARATSIVRYASGSVFPRHIHDGGEEILVLEGTFQDEHGDYPAGTYFRNPPGSSHIPASKDGCTIFVRLWQFRAGDHAHVVRRPGEGDEAEPRAGLTRARILFDDGVETVRLDDWAAGAEVTMENARGLEFFVMAGSLMLGQEKLEAPGWGRLPTGMGLNATAGPHGATVWTRQAPLLHADVCQLPL